MKESNYIYLYILNNINCLNNIELDDLLLDLELTVYSSVLKYKFKDLRSLSTIRSIICKELDLRRSVKYFA